MEWIRQNVALFGGDPDNVTLFGESDGATGVGLQVTAFGGVHPALFKRAIMASGSAATDHGMTTGKSQNNTQAMTAILKCSNADTVESIDCLRNLTLEEMLPSEINYTMSIDIQWLRCLHSHC